MYKTFKYQVKLFISCLPAMPEQVVTCNGRQELRARFTSKIQLYIDIRMQSRQKYTMIELCRLNILL